MSAGSCARIPASATAAEGSRWPLERVLFGLAGSVTLLSVALAALVSPWFLLLTAFVGVNQWLYVLFGACPASLILSHVFALRSVVYPLTQTSSFRAEDGS
jgi:hypothetical protein